MSLEAANAKALQLARCAPCSSRAVPDDYAHAHTGGARLRGYRDILCVRAQRAACDGTIEHADR
jgi:hypothetical protein